MKTNTKLKIIIIFIVLAIIYADLFLEKNHTLLVEENGIINVFFCHIEDCIYEFKKIINNSETLKCAFYTITNQDLIKNLKKEKAEIITHSNKEFKKNKSRGLMHHKFCIINQTHVITGSYNPTRNNRHHENLIIIESRTLAMNYEKEFEQIKRLNKDGTKKEKTTNTKIRYNNYTLENYFCPQDECRKQILNKINEANNSIKFLLFTFTDKDIARAIINKKKEGLTVKGVIDNFQNKKYWVVPLLQENNITLKINSARTLQHNKIFIIDDLVITGSYNPTNAANTINDENILMITQSDIVQEYKNYFKDLFESLDLT